MGGNTKAVVERCRPHGVRCRDSIAVGKLSATGGAQTAFRQLCDSLSQAPFVYHCTLHGELTVTRSQAITARSSKQGPWRQGANVRGKLWMTYPRQFPAQINV